MKKDETLMGGSMNSNSILQGSIGGACSTDTIRTMFPEKGSYDTGKNPSEYNKK